MLIQVTHRHLDFPHPYTDFYLLPSLAGDDAHFLAVAMWGDTAGLPPLIIRGIDDMKDVPVLEAEPLAGETTVL